MFSIKKIQGNSGSGSPVFSKQGLGHNTQFTAFKTFQKDSRKSIMEETSTSHKFLIEKLADVAEKQKFGVSDLTVNCEGMARKIGVSRKIRHETG